MDTNHRRAPRRTSRRAARCAAALVACGATLAATALLASGGATARGGAPGATVYRLVPADTGGYVWALPPGFPRPRVPDDNPMNEAKVELGQRLFYDTRLSGNGTFSCASCHRQELAFSDPNPRAVGSTGELHPRSSMSLGNVAYSPVLTWANPTLRRLEAQALVPMFGDDPVELGLAGMEDELLARLAADAGYRQWFADAFPDEPEPVAVLNITHALAAFQRTLLTGNSPYDRYRRGQADAISDLAKLGEKLFFSERLECFHCHGGFNFTSTEDYAGKGFAEIEFHNTGLYNIDGRGGYPAPNIGLREFTHDPEDTGRFKAPTLRNIAVTAPYMHDGSIATLEEVLDHYAAGGRTIPAGRPNAGVGSASPYRSMFVVGFELTDVERAAVLAFLQSLTDSTFLADPRFSNPWADPPAARGAGR